MLHRRLSAASALTALLAATGCQDVNFSSDAASPAASVQGAAGADVTVTDLGTLGGCCGTAYGVNEHGDVVGSSSTASGEGHPFLWTAASGMIDLGSLGGGLGYARAINDVGQVAGTSRIAEGWDRAFLWIPGEGMMDLGSLTDENSYGADINNLGHVVGSTSTPAYETHAFLWTPETGMVDLGRLPGEPDFRVSHANAISDLGHVAGTSTTASGDFHAFLWTADAGMQDLGALGGGYSFATDVNALGQVVGYSTTAAGDMHAFLWTPEGGMIDLGTLPGGSTSSEAYGINDRGEVVGWSTPNTRPFIWSPGAGMRELPPLAYGGGQAKDLNEKGQVVGSSPPPNLPNHPVLWSVAPSVLAVALDIKPGSAENPINTRSRGRIPVAILSNAEFDAATAVDRASLTFGPTGDEPSLHLRGGDVPNCGVEDVNDDGYADLVCHFDTQRAGFQVGDTEGVLRGQTADGTPLEGRDAVRIVP